VTEPADPNAPATAAAATGPRAMLSTSDVVVLIVGIVVGAGIFRLPGLVAANAGTAEWVVAVWIAGGAVSLAGALCFSELTSTYPNAGGEYHYLRRAYGAQCGFLFAWSRLVVVQTGSIALLAQVFGDYAAVLAPFGPYGASLYAAVAVVLFTALNLLGLHHSRRAQLLLTTLTVAGLLAIVAAGLTAEAPAEAVPPPSGGGALGLAMVFVLLTYGGWNEAAYVSAEVRDGRRSMPRALVLGIVLVTAIYVLVNLALLEALGVGGLAASTTAASDVAGLALGASGAAAVATLVAVVALASLNVSIFTGARTTYALAGDFPLFGALDRWNRRTGAPSRALLLQGAIALLLVAMGATTRDGFQTLVEFVSPVFWAFFLLTGLSLFVLRRREPDRPRPFRVPFYPVVPALFCASCAYLLYSSLAYTGVGALAGVAVLASGMPVLWLARRHALRVAEGGS